MNSFVVDKLRAWRESPLLFVTDAIQVRPSDQQAAALATFINIGGTATVPAADITDGSSSILINGNTSRLFALDVATTIGIIASAIQTVTLEFYL